MTIEKRRLVLSHSRCFATLLCAMEMLLTVEQVAARLQLHPETIRRQLLRGALRGVRRGRQWRIPESALTETVDAPAPMPKGQRRAAIQAARGSLRGIVSSDDFLVRRHAEAQSELEKSQFVDRAVDRAEARDLAGAAT